MRPRSTFTVPNPPDDLSYADALADPTRLPLKTRAAAAHAALESGTIDGWQALAFTLYGVAALSAEDEPLPHERLDENGDWIICDEWSEIDA